MNKVFLPACLLACLVTSVSTAYAATPPKVVFIGDSVTYNWTSAFAANPNWINKGANDMSLNGPGGSAGVLARFQSDVVSQHPATVHIMIGAGDASWIYDYLKPIYVQAFFQNLDAMVKEAKAANIKVVLGLEAQNFLESGPAGNLELINAVVAAYGTANNIPVVNYGDVLCGCVGSITPGGIGVITVNLNSLQSVSKGLMGPAAYAYASIFPNTDGYALMTQMAETAVATMGLTIKSGYLQNVEIPYFAESIQQPIAVNLPGITSNGAVQFTAQATWSDGVTRPVLNSTFGGSSGTWTSSNPLVMYVDQKGLAQGLTVGKAQITYRSPTGVLFNPWNMTVSTVPF